jgi:hypothetical protein
MTSPGRIKILPTTSIKNISKVKEEIKAALPYLDAKDIRRLVQIILFACVCTFLHICRLLTLNYFKLFGTRYKIPYNEAVLLELQEEGSQEAAEYLKFLFNLDEEKRMVAWYNAAILDNPKLKDNNELIDYLRNFLTNLFQPSSNVVI